MVVKGCCTTCRDEAVQVIIAQVVRNRQMDRYCGWPWSEELSGFSFGGFSLTRGYHSQHQRVFKLKGKF